MSTIKDVAREAGVSIATVSNYLNRTKPVSKEASKAIQSAIESLKYTHNIMARNVRTKRNMDIGIILPDIDDSYYVQIFRGIKSYFENTEYTINLEFSRNVPEIERSIVENFLKKRICGMFLVSSQPEHWKYYYESFSSKNIPLVLIDRNVHGLDANFVSFDYCNFMKKITRQLLKKEYKEICIFSGPNKYTSEADCIRGFTEACTEYGVTISKQSIINTDMSKEDAFRKTIKLLSNKKTDAIVTTSELLAKGVIEGIVLSGSNVQQIPVATLSEEHWNQHTNSFATVLGVRTAIKLGEVAAGLMEKQLASPLARENEKILLSDCRVCEKEEFLVNDVRVLTDKPRTLRLLMLKTAPIDALLGMMQHFEDTTGIKVEVSSVPYDFMYETIVKSHSEQIKPSYDVIMYAMPWLPFFVSEQILQDITEDVKEISTHFFENSLRYFGEVRGNCYGVPVIYGPQILYYRKDLFDNPIIKAEYEKESSISLRPPVTLKEFNSIAEFFTNQVEDVPYGISIAAENSACLSLEIYMRLRAYGASIFDEKGNVCLDSEQTLKAYINFMRSLKYAKPDYRENNNETATENFLEGRTAMLISYPHFFTDVTDLRRNRAIGEIGYHVVPGRAPLLGGWGLGINTKSEQKKEAMEFLRWTCSEQIAQYSVALGGQPAITNAYTNDALVDLYPWLKLYHSMNEYAEPIMPPILENGKVIPLNEIDEIICKWVYQLMDTDLEVIDAIKNTHQELEELVEKYKSM